MSQNQDKPVERLNVEFNDSQPSRKDNSTLQASDRRVAKLEEFSKFESITSAKNGAIDVYIKPEITEQPTKNENLNTLKVSDEDKIQDRRGDMHDESFRTMETYLKEKMADSHENTTFNRDQWMQRVIAVNGEAPPPYERVPLPDHQTRNSENRNQVSHYQTSGDDAPDGLPWSNYLYSPPSFQEITIRHDFVKKVFAILGSQLFFTLGMILLTLFHEPTKTFVAEDLVLLSVMTCMIFVLYLVLICYKATRRIFPLNFILLALLTISMSYLCAAVSCKTESKAVLITIGGTCAVCFVVSLLAFQTWFDITKWSFILHMAIVVVLIFSLIVATMSIFSRQTVLYLVYSGVIVTLFSVFLMFDIQCILGGRRMQLSPEEYIVGALTLYVDIILIFMYMLNLIRACF